MIFEQQLRRRKGYLYRLDGSSSIRRKCRHQNRRTDVTMLRDNRRFLGITVVRIVSRGHSRLGQYGGCESFVETPSRVCKRVCKTNKKIRERKEHQQRPAYPRRFRLRRCAIDPMIHYLRLANFVFEHYHNIRKYARELLAFRKFDFETLS